MDESGSNIPSPTITPLLAVSTPQHHPKSSEGDEAIPTPNMMVSLLRRVYSFIRTCAIILINLCITSFYLFLMWCVFLPVAILHKSTFYWIENGAYNIALFIVSSWSWLGGMQVIECGDDIHNLPSHPVDLTTLSDKYGDPIKMKAKNLLIGNHQSTADVPLLFQSLVYRCSNVIMWVMSYEFKYTNFGVVSWSHGDFFINPKNFIKDQLTKHCLRYPDKDLIILFPEGGFRYKLQQSSDRFAQKQGWPSMTHLVWPRQGAFMDLMEGGLPFGYIIDLTILYRSQEGAPSLLDIMGGYSPQKVYFYYRVFKVDPNVTYNEKWLNDRWIEKDAIIASFYGDKDAFLDQLPQRAVTMSYLRIFLANCFYLIGCFSMISFIYFLFKFVQII